LRHLPEMVVLASAARPAGGIGAGGDGLPIGST